ncbi:MAG: phosphohydrolase [bacterium]
MASQCPGQDPRKITISVHPCPNCGYAVEFFSDEIRVKCPSCKTYVTKERLPTCIEWCKAARECIGEERWKALMEQMDKKD